MVMAAKEMHFYHEEFQPTSSSSEPAFPLLAIAVLSIMGTAFLLVSYYFFVSKCYSNWPQLNLIRRISLLRARQNDEDPSIAFSPTMWSRGLDDSVIREIPTIQFKREVDERRNILGCMVCLNDFQEHDMLRMLPGCSHTFHLDCIDIWLQENVNCPLCRTSVSGTTRYPLDHIAAPSSSPQGSTQPYDDSLLGCDEDVVVIELRGEDGDGFFSRKQQERVSSSGAVFLQAAVESSKKMDQKLRFMGDECIDARDKDDQFSIQPMRRSFSLDSAGDLRLFLSVQSIIHPKRGCRETNATEGCSANRVPKSLLPLGQGRGSRNAVLPVDFDL